MCVSVLQINLNIIIKNYLLFDVIMMMTIIIAKFKLIINRKYLYKNVLIQIPILLMIKIIISYNNEISLLMLMQHIY